MTAFHLREGGHFRFSNETGNSALRAYETQTETVSQKFAAPEPITHHPPGAASTLCAVNCGRCAALKRHTVAGGGRFVSFSSYFNAPAIFSQKGRLRRSRQTAADLLASIPALCFHKPKCFSDMKALGDSAQYRKWESAKVPRAAA